MLIAECRTTTAIVSIQQETRRKVCRAFPQPPGCCRNVTSVLTLANNLHGYEAKARVFTRPCMRMEENLRFERGLFTALERKSVLSWKNEETAVVKGVKRPKCKRSRDSYICEREDDLTSRTTDSEALYAFCQLPRRQRRAGLTAAAAEDGRDVGAGDLHGRGLRGLTAHGWCCNKHKWRC